MKFKYRYLLILITLFLIFLSMNSMAQPGDPGGDPDVPITGIEILLALGGALGIKHLIGSKKSKDL